MKAECTDRRRDARDIITRNILIINFKLFSYLPRTTCTLTTTMGVLDIVPVGLKFSKILSELQRLAS